MTIKMELIFILRKLGKNMLDRGVGNSDHGSFSDSQDSVTMVDYENKWASLLLNSGPDSTGKTCLTVHGLQGGHSQAPRFPMG
jgi:hypothetical protein